MATAIKRALAPLLDNGGKFAVVSCGGMQYKVTTGDIIAVQRLRAEIGSAITLKKVHMVGGERFTAIGRPLLENCRVVCDVEEQKRMRNVVSIFAPYRHRRVRFVDCPHAATILRVREIQYEPQVVGEVDKYRGVVLEPSKFDPKESPNKTYWANEAEAKHGNAFLDLM